MIRTRCNNFWREIKAFKENFVIGIALRLDKRIESRDCSKEGLINFEKANLSAETLSFFFFSAN